MDLPNIQRGCVGTNAPKPIRHRFGITHGSKSGLDSSAGNGREKILKIHSYNNPLTNVRGSKCLDGATFKKSVGRWMRRNFFEYGMQNPLLDFFETRLRRFNQSYVSRFFGEQSIMIMPQFRICRGGVGELLQIGEPFQFP